MNLETEALRIAETLQVGQTRRGQCPACDDQARREAGKSTSPSWIVGRESDRVWFKCFRATCPGPASGIVGSANLAPAVQAERSRAVERLMPYELPTRPLTTLDYEYFRQRFEIDAYGYVGTTDEDEYIVKILGPHGRLRGHVVRQPVWRGSPRPPRIGRLEQPKTKLYASSTEPMLAWFKPTLNDGSRELVLVEDQISAMKVAEAGWYSVALLGNGLNVEGVRDIMRWKPNIVTIALDPGAEGAAQNIAKKWGLYFQRTRVLALEEDPKDLPMDILIEELTR